MPEELTLYHDLVQEYLRRYGTACWPTIYQADVRCRCERMQAYRRKGLRLHETNADMAKAAGFDSAKPWRYVWRQAVDDAPFWLKELQEKCLLVLTKSASSDNVLDGDVLVANKTPSMPAQLAGLAEEPKRKHESEGKGKRRAEAEPYSARERQRTHNANPDGMMSTNRSGKTLCMKFQREECKGVGVCPANASFVHQCARCLSQNHGAYYPTECKEALRTEPTVRNWGKGGKSRGRGRGGR